MHESPTAESPTADLARRRRIVAAARACLGTPWVHQGRRPGVGLDCVGLLVAIARALGVAHVDLRAYPRDPTGVLVPTLRRSLVELPLAMVPQLGDVVVFRIRREPQHVAVIVDRAGCRHGSRNMVHALRDTPVSRVVEHVYDAAWQRRAVHLFTWPGLAGGGAAHHG